MRRRFWRRNAAANRRRASANADFAFRYTVPYTARSAVASIALTTPTITLPIAKRSAISIVPHASLRLNACHNRASPSEGLAPHLLECGPVLLEVLGQEVWRGVCIARGPRQEPILHEKMEVMPDRAVVEGERIGELMAVPGALPERLEDPCSVRAAPRPPDEVPQELTDRCAQGARQGVPRINSVPGK